MAEGFHGRVGSDAYLAARDKEDVLRLELGADLLDDLGSAHN